MPFIPDNKTGFQPSSGFIPDAQPTQPQEGFLKRLGREALSVATIPIRPVVNSGVLLGETLGTGIAYGASKLTGNPDYYNRAIQGTQQNASIMPGLDVQGRKTGMAGVKQIGGEAIDSAANIAQFMGLGAVSQAATQPLTFARGVIQGGLQGAKMGALYGGASGVSGGLKEDKTASQIAERGAFGALGGGLTGGILGGILGGVTGSIRGHLNKTRLIREGLSQETPPASVAGYKKVEGSTNYQRDPVAREAMKQGISGQDVQFIKDTPDIDKKAFREMYDITKKVAENPRNTRQAIEKPGQYLVDQMRYLSQSRSTIGKELGDLARNMPQTSVDISSTVDDFNSNLGQAGIAIGEKGKLDFTQSRFANQGTVQKYLQKVADLLMKNGDGTLTPQDIIRGRQTIFTDLKYATAKQGIVSGDFSKVIIDKVYDTLDDGLKVINPRYGEAAQLYAQSSDALRKFGQLMGSDFNVYDASALRAGEVGRRMMGNAPSKATDIIQDLTDTARVLGYKGTENVRDQYFFANFLEKFFGTTPSQSIGGQMTQAAGNAQEAIKAVESIGKGDTGGLVRQGLRAGYNLVKNVNPPARIQALEKLLGITVGALRTR